MSNPYVANAVVDKQVQEIRELREQLKDATVILAAIVHAAGGHMSVSEYDIMSISLKKYALVSFKDDATMCIDIRLVEEPLEHNLRK